MFALKSLEKERAQYIRTADHLCNQQPFSLENFLVAAVSKDLFNGPNRGNGL